MLPLPCRGTSSHCPVWRAEEPQGHKGDLKTVHPGTGFPLALLASSRPPAPPAWPQNQSGSEWKTLGLEWMYRGEVTWEWRPEWKIRLYGPSCPRCPQLAVWSPLSVTAKWSTMSHLWIGVITCEAESLKQRHGEGGKTFFSRLRNLVAAATTKIYGEPSELAEEDKHFKNL